MATAAEIQTAYRAIVRVELNATTAAAIASSGVALDTYINGLISQQASTTGAAVAIASFITGVTPTSVKLDELKVAADAQVASYTKLGVADPALGAFEAFGRGFATDPTTTAGFNTKYGALSSTDFINVVYAQVYGATPSAGAFANLSAQITYFTNLFTVNNVPNAAIAAKGAVLGQIVGYAFTSSASANSNLDNQVNAVLSQAAKGDTTVYNKALPVVVDPGQTGVTINFTTGADIIGPGVADPALKSTGFNDTINGTFTAGNKIDAGGGDDVANLKFAGAIAITAGQLVSAETVNLTATAGASSFDVDKATGIKSVGFVDNVGDLSAITNIAAGVNLTATDSTPVTGGIFVPNSASVVFTYKDVTGSSDVANLTVNGLDDVTKSVSVAGVETINLTASGNNSIFKLDDAALKTLSITATKNASIDLAADLVLETITGTGAGSVSLANVSNTVKTVDFSASSGANTLDVGDAAVTIKGGSGVDTFTDIKATNAVVTGGAGNDIITFNIGDATKAGSVTGGVGGDTLNLGVGKITAIYTAQADSTNANFDTVTGFTTTVDKLDFKGLALAGDKTGINTFAAGAALADGTDYFAGKAVAYGNFNNGGVATGFFVLADINNNGKFDVNSDLIISVNNGPAGVAFGDFIFS